MKRCHIGFCHSLPHLHIPQHLFVFSTAMYNNSDFSFSFQRVLVACVSYYILPKGITENLPVVVISTSLMARNAEHLLSVIRHLHNLFALIPIQVFCLFLFSWINCLTMHNYLEITVYYRYKSLIGQKIYKTSLVFFIYLFTLLILSSKLQTIFIFDDIIGLFLPLHLCCHGTWRTRQLMHEYLYLCQESY